MINILGSVRYYTNLGYKNAYAFAKAGQDIFIYEVSKSPFVKNTVLKGGVYIQNLSNDVRRATLDIDLDMRHFSISDDSLFRFFQILNSNDDGIIFQINNKPIELHQQDYKGKRLEVTISDSYKNKITLKFDIGVQTDIDIFQPRYTFQVQSLNKSVILIVNSMEQSFTEKIKSLLKYSYASTRYKDLFDFYFFIKDENFNPNNLKDCLKRLILDDKNWQETIHLNFNSIDDIIYRLQYTFSNSKYRNSASRFNWNGISVDKACGTIIEFLSKLK